MESREEKRIPTSCHFTYCPPTGTHLQQGDILRKSEGIKEILKSVHPHYLKEDYTHFIILTQSCDLVIQKNAKSYNARYISIAAIRPLDLVLERELAKYQNVFAKSAGVCKKSVKLKLFNFLESLLNNNNKEYFYLHEQPELGFPENSCAFLRLSIAIKTQENYDVCLDSRVLSLQDTFQAKLGWLVGTMYSRVGTEDWVPTYKERVEFEEMIEEILGHCCQWVDEKKLKIAEKNLSPEILGAGPDALREHINNTTIESKREEVVNLVVKCMEEMEDELGVIKDEKKLQQFRNRLMNYPGLSSILK